MQSTQLIELINNQLLSLISRQTDPLLKPAHYVLSSGGKRLRPLIVLETLISLGRDPIEGLDAACALEMIHTYSLIHDDLPCMDNDDFRRGKPSLHRVFGEATALLVGDFFLTYSFEILSKMKTIPSEQILQLIKILSKKSGGFGMIGGQLLEFSTQEIFRANSTLEEIHLKKTGALFECAFEFSGIIAGCSLEKINELSLIGKKFGLLYQILDDIEDFELEKKEFNLCHLFGLEKAKERAFHLFNECNTLLAFYNIPAITTWMNHHEKELKKYETFC